MIDRALAKDCTIFMGAHGQAPVRQQLQALADSAYAELWQDTYGEGGATTALEARMRALTAREDARFVGKGMIAQMAALRTWAERSGRMTVAVHRLSHFDYDEMGALERVQSLRVLRVGNHVAPFTVADLDALGELPGVVSVELPLRRAGYKLTPWSDLVAISDWCRQRNVPFHIDGARAWGAAVAYGKPISEIAALGSSMYMSFYKELGALMGCILVGDKAFIEQADAWLSRHGAAIYRQFPAAISALEGLDKHLPRLPEYAARAKEIAAAINQLDGAYTIPQVPHTNGFQICLALDVKRAEAALEPLTRSSRIWTTVGFYEMARDGHCGFDVEIGSAAASLTAPQWADHIGKLIAAAAELATAAE